MLVHSAHCVCADTVSLQPERDSISQIKQTFRELKFKIIACDGKEQTHLYTTGIVIGQVERRTDPLR